MFYAGYGGRGPMIQHPRSWRQEQCQGFEAPSVPAFPCLGCTGSSRPVRVTHRDNIGIRPTCHCFDPISAAGPFSPTFSHFPSYSRADLYHMTNGTMKEFQENELRSRALVQSRMCTNKHTPSLTWRAPGWLIQSTKEPKASCNWEGWRHGGRASGVG